MSANTQNWFENRPRMTTGGLHGLQMPLPSTRETDMVRVLGCYTHDCTIVVSIPVSSCAYTSREIISIPVTPGNA